MRVLIPGGSGLIGRALAVSLARDEYEVIILSRHPEQVIGLPKGVSSTLWNGRTAEGWGSLVDGVDAIVNLAGENIGSGRWTDKRKTGIVESRLNAGRAVVDASIAAARKPRVVIQASGVGYYGPGDDMEITEESPPGHDFLAGLAEKWEASTASLKESGVRHVVIRTGVVLNVEGGALPRIVLPFRLFAGGRLGNGRQWFPWIHIDDEVAAIRFLIEHETAAGPFNLTAPSPVTNVEFSRLLGRRLKKPAFMPAPGFALRLLFGEMATLVLDGQRAIPKRLLQLGFTFKFPEAGLALMDLL